MWPKRTAEARDGERGVDEELGREGRDGLGMGSETEGEKRDGLPWPQPH